MEMTSANNCRSARLNDPPPTSITAHYDQASCNTEPTDSTEPPNSQKQTRSKKNSIASSCGAHSGSKRLQVVSRLFNSASNRATECMSTSRNGVNMTTTKVADSNNSKFEDSSYNSNGHLAVFQRLRKEQHSLVCRVQCSDDEIVFKAGECIDDSEPKSKLASSCCIDQLVANSLRGNASTILATTNDRYERDALLFGSVQAIEMNRKLGKSNMTNTIRKSDGVLSEIIAQYKHQQLCFEEEGLHSTLGVSAFIVRGRHLSMVQDVFNLKARPLTLTSCDDQPLGAFENHRKHFDASCNHLVLSIWPTVEPAQYTISSGLANLGNPAEGSSSISNANVPSAITHTQLPTFGKLSLVLLGMESEIELEEPRTGTLRSQQVQLKADLASLQFLLASLVRQQQGRRVNYLDLSIHCDSCTITRAIVDSLFSKGARNVLLAGWNATSAKVLNGELSLLHFVDNILSGRATSTKGGAMRPIGHVDHSSNSDFERSMLNGNSRSIRSDGKKHKKGKTKSRNGQVSSLCNNNSWEDRKPQTHTRSPHIESDHESSDGFNGSREQSNSNSPKQRCTNQLVVNEVRDELRERVVSVEELKFNKRSLLKGTDAHRKGIQACASCPQLSPIAKKGLEQMSQSLKAVVSCEGLGQNCDMMATDSLFQLRQHVRKLPSLMS